MIAGYVFAAEFPQSRIEISDIDYVPCGVTDLYPVTDAVRLANKNVNPRDETFHRRLDSEANDDRANAQGGKRAIPIDKNYRHNYGRDRERGDQTFDALEGEPDGGVLDSTQSID